VRYAIFPAGILIVVGVIIIATELAHGEDAFRRSGGLGVVLLGVLMLSWWIRNKRSRS
jgi:hypothetical protein